MPTSRSVRPCPLAVAAVTTLGVVVGLGLPMLQADALGAEPSIGQAITEGPADLVGAWSRVQHWPIIAIHAVLAPNGNLLTFGADGDSPNATGTGPKRHDTYDPRIGLHATVAQDEQDYFCSATVIVPESSTILIGGGDDLLKGARGNALASFYDPDTGLVEPGPDMNAARWYATATTLPDGRVLLQGGRGDTNADAALTPEIFDGTSWTDLPGATSFDAYGLVGEERRWWYPRAFVDGDGGVFTISHSTMLTLDPAGEGSLSFHGELPAGHRGGATSSAVMYAPGTILLVGGGGESNSIGGPALASATIIDITSGRPVVTPVAPMHYPRHWPDATVLPNGQVLVNGGSAVNNELEGIAFPAEIWDPVTRAWTVVASESRARLYHSSSVLMPDGRVYSGGGGAPGPIANLDAQFYSPPYLFDGAGAPRSRPVIDWAPPAIAWGGEFELVTAARDDVARVTLVKTGAATHSFNMDQRFLELEFRNVGDRTIVTAPANPNLATPGYYLLSVIDADGTVSESRIVGLRHGTAIEDVARLPVDEVVGDEPVSGPDADPVSNDGSVPSKASGGSAGGCSVAAGARTDGALALLLVVGLVGVLRRGRVGFAGG